MGNFTSALLGNFTSALTNTLDGTAIGRHAEHHRHQGFIAFFGQTTKEVLVGRPTHAILDNYFAHKHQAVLDWLAEHPRWTFHYMPTSCSRMNTVEGFFGRLARLRRDVYDSIKDLKTSTLDLTELHNEKEAKPFKWTASPERNIPARQKRCRMTRTRR